MFKNTLVLVGLSGSLLITSAQCFAFGSAPSKQKPDPTPTETSVPKPTPPPAPVPVPAPVPIVTPTPPSSSGMNSDQRRRAEQLTSIFENGTPVLQYGYVENLHDGRGYTAGRAGFCSGTGDMVMVVRLYVQMVPGNPLATYLPRLEELDAHPSGNTNGLSGLPEVWATQAANDPLFRQAQDTIVDRLYFNPAMAKADQLGLHFALSRACFYDTIIQHGDGDDPDSINAIIDRTVKQVGGSPATGIDEHIWLKAFMEMRRADLAHAYDASTRKVWAESVPRADVLLKILDLNNHDLNGPIAVDVFDYKGTLD